MPLIQPNPVNDLDPHVAVPAVPAEPAPPAAPGNYGPREILELLQQRHAEILQGNGVQPPQGAGMAPYIPGRAQQEQARPRVRQNARLPITQEDITVEVAAINGNPVTQTWYAILNVPKRRKFLKKNADQTWEWLDTDEGAIQTNSQEQIIRTIEEYLATPDFNPAIEIYTRRQIQNVRAPRRAQAQRNNPIRLENRPLRDVLTARI